MQVALANNHLLILLLTISHYFPRYKLCDRDVSELNAFYGSEWNKRYVAICIKILLHRFRCRLLLQFHAHTNHPRLYKINSFPSWELSRLKPLSARGMCTNFPSGKMVMSKSKVFWEHMRNKVRERCRRRRRRRGHKGKLILNQSSFSHVLIPGLSKRLTCVWQADGDLRWPRR